MVCDTRSLVHCPARSIVTAQCVERRTAQRFVAALECVRLIFDGFRVKTLCRTTSPPLATAEASAASVVHLSLVGLTATHRPMVFPSGRSMTIRASNQSCMYSLHIKRHGLKLPMNYHSSLSYQRKFLNPALVPTGRKRRVLSAAVLARGTTQRSAPEVFR